MRYRWLSILVVLLLIGCSRVVRVVEDEWSIQAPEQVRAGETTIEVINRGLATHQLRIVDAKHVTIAEVVVEPGQRKGVTVDLKPGRYTLVCDLPGHSRAGMVAEIVVR